MSKISWTFEVDIWVESKKQQFIFANWKKVDMFNIKLKDTGKVGTTLKFSNNDQLDLESSH